MYTSSQPVNLKCTPSDRQMYKYPVGKPWFSVFSIKRKLCTALTVDSMIILPSPAEKLNKIFTKFGVQRIVDTLVLQCFVHSYCVIPSNVPFMNQHDALVCEQSDHWHDSLQTYITAVSRCFLWHIQTPNLLFIILILILHLTVTFSDFTLKCILSFLLYIWI